MDGSKMAVVYKHISIPEPLALEIDRVKDKYGFSSRAEVVKHAVREYLRSLKKPE